MRLSRSLLLLCCLSATPALWALGPTDIANKTIRLNMNESQVARSEIHQEPALPWYQLGSITDFVIDFPEKGAFSAPVKYGVNLSNEVQVNYAPNSEQNQACIKLGCDDFSVQVQLTYTSNTEGTATIAWHEAGDTRHFRHVTFTVQDDFDVASRVELPEEIISTDPEPELNDGLTDIISRLEKTTYRSSTDKLYRKRLLTLLPEVMMLNDVSRTTPDYKGNTALHYACGLSDVELVQWLVDHGADLEMSTEKGVSIDACVGGKNAPQIKAILKEARARRDKPFDGPSVDVDTAREAAAWLEMEFSGCNMEKPDYDITFNEKKVREAAQQVYRYTKANKSMISLGLDRTEPLAGLLDRVLNAKVSEDMFVAWIVRDLKQSRLRMQVVHRSDGLALATLPHMIMVREAEGMPYDGATALYRAACEGNVDLVSWLLEHDADTRLTDKHGKVVKTLKNIPNEEAIRNLINRYIAPSAVAGKKFTFRPKQGGAAICASWQGMNEETEGTVKEGEDWSIIKTGYTRTGPDSATVTRHAEWSPGGHYADGWTTYEFRLKFTSPTGGTATCTIETKQTEPTTISGTFTIK